MKNHTFRFSAFMTLLALILFSTPLSAKKQELPEISEEGLHLVDDTKLAIVYADPEASLAGYKRVQMLDPYVAFRKNWLRDQRSRSVSSLSVTSKDVENIKNSLAELFSEVFKEELEKAGYELTDSAGDDVLLIRPAIINLDVNAPDVRPAVRMETYTASAGEMTLYIELYDSVTSDMIAKALDRRADNAMHSVYTWTNAVTNRAAATRILKGWATILVNALNEAHQGTGAQSSG